MSSGNFLLVILSAWVVSMLCLMGGALLFLRWKRRRRQAKLDVSADQYLAKMKVLNDEIAERKRRLVHQLRLCSPAIKINGKREAAYWNATLKALAECDPMDDKGVEAIAVLFANLEQDFGREIVPNHLEKDAALIAKAERCWRKLLDIIGDPKKILAEAENRPQA